MKKLISAFTIASLTSGCASTIESFYNRQVVEDKLVYDHTAEQEIGTLAVTAQRRLIVANLKTGKFCSEPPPEVADSITTAIAAALKANIAANKNVGAELASNFARHVNQLYKRAHTVQLFRDASYYLCVNAINSSSGRDGAYESYKAEMAMMMKNILPYLEKEVEAYYDVEKARAEHPPAVFQETVVCDSTATLDKTSDDSGNRLATSITCRPISENNRSEPEHGTQEKAKEEP